MMCCPHYTIRQDAVNFRPSKSHKKIIKRVNRFLITGERPGAKDVSNDGDADMASEGAGGDNFMTTKSSELSLSHSDIKADQTGEKGVSPSLPVGTHSKGQTADSQQSTQSVVQAESRTSQAKEKQAVKNVPKPGENTSKSLFIFLINFCWLMPVTSQW